MDSAMPKAGTNRVYDASESFKGGIKPIFGNEADAKPIAKPKEKIQESPTPNHDIAEVLLLGTMPRKNEALKDEILLKLTAKYEWKQMRVSLTEDAIFLSRPDENPMRDVIPLVEISRVNKVNQLNDDEIVEKRKLKRNGGTLV